MPIELKVFPDTGHQYFTFKLEELCPDSSAEELNKLVQQHLGDPWQIWDPYPWVRYQYALSKDVVSRQVMSAVDGVPVINIAVETNMSIPRNGLLWEVDAGLNEKGNEEFLFPYACDDASRVRENLGEERSVPLFSLPNKLGKEISVDMHVVFLKPAGNDPIDVDLVIDLGNTRTAALLLETRGIPDRDQWPFSRRVKVLRFTPPGTQYDNPDKDCEIIPSWLLMHRTTFAALEPNLNFSQLYDIYESYEGEGKTLYRRKKYLPRSFIEMSPAMIGGGKSQAGMAKRLADLVMTGGRYYFSSPKRYIWDDAQTGSQGSVYWMQVKHDTDPDKMGGKLAELGGMVRIYMDPEAADWDIDNPPSGEEFLRRYSDRPPSYPRRDTLCWFALSILESAYRQINSDNYLTSTGYAELPRRLRYVMATYPAAWNHEIKRLFHDQWERAINLFTIAHFDTHHHKKVSAGGLRPELVDANVSEAICSQLPIMYSDISTLLNNPESWFKLYGNTSDQSVIVMNLDIGGGTTDMTVIRYQAAQNGSIRPHLLFQDGRATAGDELVKKIIERLLIPAWIKAGDTGQYKDLPDAKSWVLSLLSDPSNQEISPIDPLASNRLARITRLLFIPIVNELLSGMAGMEDNPEARLETLDLSNLSASLAVELNDLTGKIIRQKCRNGRRWKGEVFPMKNVRLNIPAAEVDLCIEEVFGQFCKSLGQVAAHFRCHLVIVTGKPSELPKLRQLITESFPILPQRIIHARNFPAGRWYPFGSFGGGEGSGRIMDAKSCTVVGAALYLDSLKNPHLTKFLTIEDTAGDMKGRYFWGVVPTHGHNREFYERGNLLFSPSDYSKAVKTENRMELEKEFELIINNCRIGRQIIRVENIRPDPIYELCFIAGRSQLTAIRKPVRAKVKLRWVLEKDRGESLELVKATLLEPVDDADDASIRLRLNTLYESSFWLDDPRFEIDENAVL